MKRMLFGILVLLIALFYGANCDSNPDKIKSLPGLTETPNFKQYSGYLNATKDGDKKLHYWFVESQNDPTTDPLILWLNGGPGCSSLDGFFSENGPFQVTEGGKGLTVNPYSWNKLGNVLYLESPAGVGFSYAVSKNLTTDDNVTADENYQALLSFFEKYPQFQQNDFFISGESYAGIYIPMLAVRILNESQNISLQGLAIGNGFYDRPINFNAAIYFAYYHGLIGHLLWESLQEKCCTPTSCNFYLGSEDCKPLVDEAHHFMNRIGLNDYALYRDCAGGIPKGSTALKRFLFDFSTVTGNKSVEIPEWLHFHKMDQARTPYHPLYVQHDAALDCVDTTAETAYLNRKDVREAIHIPSSVQDWAVCSDDVQGNYSKNSQTMRPQFKMLLDKYRVLLYNGDTDIVCPLNSAEGFVASLGLNSTGDRRTWLCGDQVAGFVEEKGPLTLMTVKGSGHMVPQWKPPQAFQMISNFLKGKPQ